MPRKRTLETAEERSERLKLEALRATGTAQAQENAIDVMVRQSIKLHGA